MLNLTPFEVKRRRLPPPTLDAVHLGLVYCFSKKPTGTLLQIGAFDGVSNDPVFEFIRANQIRAILVEPFERNVRKLEKAYEGMQGVSVVQAAIAYEDGNATMFRAKNTGRWSESNWVGQIASFDQNHLLRHGVQRDEIEEVSVETLSLPSLLSRCNVDSVEFLQVDTEGFDAEVVKMSLMLPVKPSFINFEHYHLNVRSTRDVFSSLKKHDYRWVHSQSDTLAIRE
jgi:FkbM family methyltransferase